MNLNSPPTPHYLIDKAKLLSNLEKIDRVLKASGCKVLLALKCFSTWSTFDFISSYLDGTTSSSLYEVRLGKEKFGGETHAYSVAYSDDEIDETIINSDKIIFNSVSQLARFSKRTQNVGRGLRVNPGFSYSKFELANPSMQFSRLGEWRLDQIENSINLLSGLMFHNHCDNDDYESFDNSLRLLEDKFGYLFDRIDWISLGGGISFTSKNYPFDRFSDRLAAFSDKYQLQVYLEPGEAVVSNSSTLEVTVLDTFEHGKNLAIVDSSVEAHMLDLLIYRLNAKIQPNNGYYNYQVCGRSCLAGDIFGDFNFETKLKVGDRISFADAAGYTMVKKNWFNGLKMPSIVIRELDGSLVLVKNFDYPDFVSSLS